MVAAGLPGRSRAVVKVSLGAVFDLTNGDFDGALPGVFASKRLVLHGSFVLGKLKNALGHGRLTHTMGYQVSLIIVPVF